MNRQQGKIRPAVFAAIAILIVLAALLLPAWHNRQTSEHVSEALGAADAAKLVVMEAATVKGSPANIKTSELNYNASSVSNPYVATVDIADGGRITVTTRNTGASPDPVFLLTPISGNDGQAAVTWSCAVIAGSSDLAPKLCQMAPAPTTPAHAASH